MRASRRRLKERGSAVVEFALVSPLIVLLLVGIMDLGRATFYYNSLANAAREGARAAVVLNYSGDWGAAGNAPGTYRGDEAVGATTIVGRAVAGANGLPPEDLEVTIIAPDTSRWMSLPVTVDVRLPFTPTTSLIVGGASFELRGQATMLIE